MARKYGSWYSEINTNHLFAMYFIVAFMLRRILLAVTLIYGQNYDWL